MDERAPLLSHAEPNTILSPAPPPDSGAINAQYGVAPGGDAALTEGGGSSVSTPSAPALPAFRAYRKRWYVLLLFSMMAFSQSWAWATWGPIAASAKCAFDWQNRMISILASWGPVCFMLTMIPFGWFVDNKGMRWACLITSFLVAAGNGIRSIAMETTAVTWLMNIAQISVSVAGPISMGARSVLSATWFPADQRFTATAISSQLMGLGGNFPSIIGPLLVKDCAGEPTPAPNSTFANSTVPEIGAGIRTLLYIELGVSCFVLLCMLVYFPAKPPTPPSASVAKRTVSFRQGLKDILRVKDFWVLSVPYTLTFGMYIGWGATLDINLEPMGVSEKQVGYIMFFGCLAGVVMGVVLGRLVDKFQGRTKPVLLVLYTLSTGASLWFALMCSQIVPFMIVGLYISRIVLSLCLSSMVPLVFEVLCEVCYPIPEAVTISIVSWMKNLWCLVFLAILWFPSVGVLWMNWLLMGSCALCVPMVLAFHEVHHRLDTDMAT